ncbi:galactose-1-phosphate uridylyltransferase [Spirulina subsalsa FACHB-351]|uniref:Galactose-1-phosphate uridylyltransferase n=1 Tax=Spirulina subsalsa FACHB-351 TaxID=234711 RepID=A0ABT3L642_9CYAN|nr:galactose-1-phosphate uridylyltransferase [Spirulina subsalsa]MCW6036966.1 galactose-1-phosphate uridylyltransferase [Spirulina subsalsa FACHB-351]
MNNSHIRLNVITKEWVIFSPSRRQRPQDFQQDPSLHIEPPCYDPHCPFCNFSEVSSEVVILEIANPQKTGWQTRVVPNKYPALTPDSKTTRQLDGIYLSMPGYGCHEVIVESPKHHLDIATMPLQEVEIVIETYHQRYYDLMVAHQNMMAIIFRNHGHKAGASLQHPHSQIIVTGMVPQHIRYAEQEAQRYYDTWSKCLYCEILAQEKRERVRMVAESNLFFAFIPFAADVPFEIWIMPKVHQADFGSISDAEKVDFASILRRVLRQLKTKLNNPDYNYVINTAARYKAEEPQVHWYCQIRPRLTTPAGFEIGSGISINPSLPESDAEYLRS